MVRIAHRLSTIAAADQTLVMKGNAVIEVGKPTKLLKAKGCYVRMWQARKSIHNWHIGAMTNKTLTSPEIDLCHLFKVIDFWRIGVAWRKLACLALSNAACGFYRHARMTDLDAIGCQLRLAATSLRA